MSEVVDLWGGQRGQVTLVLVDPSRLYTPSRLRPRIAGLTVAKAISLIKSDGRIRSIGAVEGPYEVRLRGSGRPKNEYRKVPEDSDLVLTKDHILKVVC